MIINSDLCNACRGRHVCDQVTPGGPWKAAGHPGQQPCEALMPDQGNDQAPANRFSLRDLK